MVIGHNIDFDLAFLRKFFPQLEWKFSIDTFRLAQTLIHYAPSYALEILIESLKTKPIFQQILTQFQIDFQDEESFHNAFFDAKLSIALFWYLVERVQLLSQKYPILEFLVAQSEGEFASIFKKQKSDLTS